MTNWECGQNTAANIIFSGILKYEKKCDSQIVKMCLVCVSGRLSPWAS